MYRFCVIVALSLTALVGCMSNRGTNNADIFAQAAQTALEGGDWATARRQWALAIEAGEQGGVSEGELASLYFEYGRAAGATCMYELAEDSLTRAYQLDLEGEGPAYLAQAELGRLEISQHRYAAALTYLEAALGLYVDENQGDETSASLAALKMDYARALEALGRIDEADAARMEVYKLREQDSRTDKILDFDPTPYGEYCLS